jgi:hypothetical protein
MMTSPSKTKVFQTKGLELSADAELVVKPLSDDDLKAIKMLEAKAADDQETINVCSSFLTLSTDVCSGPARLAASD